MCLTLSHSEGEDQNLTGAVVVERSRTRQIIMLRNGAFDFENIPNTKCLCGHSIYEHLIDHNGDADCCLFAKGDVCICDKYVDEGVKVVVPPKDKLPKKQVLEDPR